MPLLRRSCAWLCLACFACIAALQLAGCNRSSQAAPPQMPPPMVTTAPVTTADVPVYLDEIGNTSSSEVVTITPQVSGKIIERFFTDGADLTKGDKLFQIDDAYFRAALHAAQATQKQAEAQLANANTNFNRIAGLLGSKAVAQQDYDNAKNVVDVADANVLAGKAAVETATVNLNYCTITSPLDGRAGQRLVDVGNVVTANTTALLVIDKIQPLYVNFTIPENELDRVRSNMKDGTLKVVVESPDISTGIDGDLTFLDNSVQDGTGTIKLRATVKNESRQLWPGQFVRVKLILAVEKDALLIPSEAVQIGQTGTFVWVVHSDPTSGAKVEQRPVTPGQRQGNMTVIDKGLKSGETIVLSGQLQLRPDSPVTVAPAAGAPAANASGSKAP